MSSNIIYIGSKAQVAAINKQDGTTLWQTKLKGGVGQSFVSLLVEAGRVYAHTHGELFCLDGETGTVLWQNDLKGLGYDIASLASEHISSSSLPELVARRKKQAEDAAPMIQPGVG